MIIKTILAYLIIVALGHFCVTLGVLISSGILAFILFMFPENIRVSIGSFVGGICGSVLTFTFAYFVFIFLVGANSYTLLPFLATVFSLLLIPIRNDYNEYIRFKREFVDSERNKTVSDIASGYASGKGILVLGEITGIVVGGYLFIY